jgi:hypothetical protein
MNLDVQRLDEFFDSHVVLQIAAKAICLLEERDRNIAVVAQEIQYLIEVLRPCSFALSAKENSLTITTPICAA